jgi:hypothetical protein
MTQTAFDYYLGSNFWLRCNLRLRDNPAYSAVRCSVVEAV